MSAASCFWLCVDYTTSKRYLVIDPENLDFPLDEKSKERLRDPHKGIGADEIILLTKENEENFIPAGTYNIIKGSISPGIMKDDLTTHEERMKIIKNLR